MFLCPFEVVTVLAKSGEISAKICQVGLKKIPVKNFISIPEKMVGVSAWTLRWDSLLFATLMSAPSALPPYPICPRSILPPSTYILDFFTTGGLFCLFQVQKLAKASFSPCLTNNFILPPSTIHHQHPCAMSHFTLASPSSMSSKSLPSAVGPPISNISFLLP